MEWVETTGKTVEEAKEAALDQLGVDEQDAEFEVLEEAKSGLFGRLRTEARVRARIRPTRPRPKVERRDRRRRGASDSETPAAGDDAVEEAAPVKATAARAKAPAAKAPAAKAAAAKAPAAKSTRGRGRAAASSEDRPEETPVTSTDTATPASDRRSVAEQQAALQQYFEGLLDAFDVEGRVEVVDVDGDTLEARLEGADLGLLIGPKGATLSALQDLVRSSVQRPGDLRFRVDVGGYRERRREALERFTRQIAEQVLASGEATSLEPMNASDRKVVHDTVNTIDGVATTSEGEDPRRRVVISPAS
jgi:spoIIIJ-associated protein